MEAFKQLKKHAIVVYINTEKPQAKEHLSPIVMAALNTESMGSLIPRAVITSPDQRTYMASIDYKSMKNKKTFKNANKKVKEALAGKTTEMPKDAIISWTLTGKNNYYKGDFVKIENDKNLVLKTPEGNEISVPLEKFTQGAQAYARLLAGGDEEKTTGSKKTHELESWTSTSGKQIHARFLSVKNGKVSLEMTDGKVVTFSLTKLSKDSQKRAKELADE